MLTKRFFSNTIFCFKSKNDDIQTKIILNGFVEDAAPKDKATLKAKSASEWKWDPCKQFVELKYQASLGLTNASFDSLLPSEKILVTLSNMDENFVHPNNTAGYEEAVKNAMLKIGLKGPRIIDGELLSSPSWVSCFEKNTRLITSLYEAILEGRRNSSSADDDEPRTNEGRIDVLADDLAHLCGLADKPFKFTSKEDVKINFAGFECGAIPDVYIIENTTRELVIIFEDKAGKFENQGYLGQIVAELLMCYYTNIKKRKEGTNDQTSLVIPDRVYCIRTFLHYVTLFAMDATVKQIEDVCDKGLIPSPKITLNCDVEDPTTKDGYGKGYDLLKKDEREHVIRLIASIRQSILNRIDNNNNTDSNH